MSFPAMISIFTDSFLEMDAYLFDFINGGMVDGSVGGRVGGKVDDRDGGSVYGSVWLGGGSVVVCRDNISGIFTAFNFALFF